MICVLLLTFKGSACIYQGEELELTDYDIKFEELQDPAGKTFWPEYKGRDGCRTPMVWDSSPNSGFTTGIPWLPIPEDHKKCDVTSAENNRNSALCFYRTFLNLRKKYPALLTGSIKAIANKDNVLLLERKFEHEFIQVLINMSAKSVKTDSLGGQEILSNQMTKSENGLALGPWGFALFKS